MSTMRTAEDKHNRRCATVCVVIRLPEHIEGDGLVLRRWRVEDAELLDRAVTESAEHLRPWMPWIAHEPLTIGERRDLIAGWERDWERGGDVVLAILRGEEVAGGTGLHRRRGADALEIGYWLHPAFTGRGLATATARLLTGAAFGVPGIERVEIWHELDNVRSEAVPRRLGFDVIGEAEGDRVWRMTRRRWRPPGLVSSDG
jgi:RimJ/RimL family protein N-acetyltransferase